jgi:hypothetical protein
MRGGDSGVSEDKQNYKIDRFIKQCNPEQTDEEQAEERTSLDRHAGLMRAVVALLIS